MKNFRHSAHRAVIVFFPVGLLMTSGIAQRTSYRDAA